LAVVGGLVLFSAAAAWSDWEFHLKQQPIAAPSTSSGRALRVIGLVVGLLGGLHGISLILKAPWKRQGSLIPSPPGGSHPWRHSWWRSRLRTGSFEARAKNIASRSTFDSDRDRRHRDSMGRRL
jgi:hypothetical protein